MGLFSNILITVITHCCSNLAIHKDSFALNPSCIFWMTCDTNYIQTSNLKFSFENWESLLKFLTLLCFAVEKAPLDIEWKISCKKDKICWFIISSVAWYVFYRNCSRKLVKDFGNCWSGANRSSGFSGQGSNGATCIIFFISARKSSSTNWNNFFLLEAIKSVHGILLIFALTICGIFLL